MLRYYAPRRLAAGLLLLTLSAPHSLQNAPPSAPVREVIDDYFGQKVSDPYRWMEDSNDAETVAWMKAQADYTRDYLTHLPLRQELLDRITKLSDAGVQVDGIQVRGNLYFYYRLAPGENDRRLYVRDELDGQERLLVDPERISQPGRRYSIDHFNASLDGQYVSYRISAGGSENGEIRVVETATGNDMGERIDRARVDAGYWLPDGKLFLYNRLQDLPGGAPPTELYQKSRVYLHRLGSNSDSDKAVFGYEVNPNIKLEPAPLPYAFLPRGSKYVFAVVNSGVSPNSEYYIAPLDSITETPVPWRKIASLDDEVSDFTVHGDDLYLLVYKNTPRYKVVRTTLTNPDLSKATTIFPPGEAVVTGIAAAKDALYVQTLDGGMSRLWRVDYESSTLQALELPYNGSAFIDVANQETDGIFYDLNAWTKSPAFFRYDSKTGESKDTRLMPQLAVDMSGIQTTSVRVKAADGTVVPLVLLYKKGLKRNGENPTLLDGYGAYGVENTSPLFYPLLLAWLERGGVFALAGVRGGGEYGEEWHLAGKENTKSNTWKDFIACAEYLVKERYTSRANLGGDGGSAGGILIGNAIMERPDLFGAAIDMVGLNNPLRSETTSNGIPNIPEFGSTKTEEGFKALLAMDAYSKIKKGEKYPAVLLTTGVNDQRVEPWMSAKMAARLQAATASGKPVLLRIDYDAGHGIGSTRQQQNEELADAFAFLFQQLGPSGGRQHRAIKGPQPAPIGVAGKPPQRVDVRGTRRNPGVHTIAAATKKGQTSTRGHVPDRSKIGGTQDRHTASTMVRDKNALAAKPRSNRTTQAIAAGQHRYNRSVHHSDYGHRAGVNARQSHVAAIKGEMLRAIADHRAPAMVGHAILRLLRFRDD
jgi:prolyl oligopeptidase